MKSKIQIVAVASILLFFVVVPVVFAQGQPPSTSTSGPMLVRCAAGPDNCTIRDLIFVVIRVINFFIGASWLVALFFVFWGAYGLSTSYGNSEKIEAGKKTIQNAIVGFFLVIVAFLLINWLVMVLGGLSLEQMMELLPIR